MAEVMPGGEQDRRGDGQPRSRLLIYRCFAQTLAESAGILVEAATGRLSVKSVDKRLERWSRKLYETGRLVLDIHGLELVERGKTYVLMSNHASLLDVPSVVRAFPGSVRMVSKSELAKVPLFGAAMRKAGTVIIDRENRERAIEQLSSARELLEHGISLWIAPEGTRSKDGRLGPFKKGGFHVALQLGVPILPIFIEGTAKVLETKTLTGLPGQRITLRFGPEVPTDGLTTDDLPALMATVRRRMLELAKASGSIAAEELTES